MEKQDYKHHIRFYTPHHFVFYPMVLTGIVWSAWHISAAPANMDIWIAITALFCVVCWLSFMLRQHYALTNQDRIVRLELRLRYYQLTGQKLEPLEQRLSFKQLAALRFACDDELPALTQRAINEKLSPGAIKKAVQVWVADDMRV